MADEIERIRQRVAEAQAKADAASTSELAAAYRELEIMYRNLLDRLERSQEGTSCLSLPRTAQRRKEGSR